MKFICKVIEKPEESLWILKSWNTCHHDTIDFSPLFMSRLSPFTSVLTFKEVGNDIDAAQILRSEKVCKTLTYKFCSFNVLLSFSCLEKLPFLNFKVELWIKHLLSDFPSSFRTSFLRHVKHESWGLSRHLKSMNHSFSLGMKNN